LQNDKKNGFENSPERPGVHETRCKKGEEAKWAWLKENMEAATEEMKWKRAKAENNKDQTTLPLARPAP
jgi:hypothetical protein